MLLKFTKICLKTQLELTRGENPQALHQHDDYTHIACGKAWVNCGKLCKNCGKAKESLWKYWGICGGKLEIKIRIANLLFVINSW